MLWSNTDFVKYLTEKQECKMGEEICKDISPMCFFYNGITSVFKYMINIIIKLRLCSFLWYMQS